MATPIIQPSFVTGEVAPSLFGRVDLARYHNAAATMRNMWPSYRGGSYSRAGTAFVGFSKQTGRAYPPRLIKFQFNINQGLVLEFGNLYMRVIQDGGYVLESQGYIISAATQASPCVLTYSAPNYAISATYEPTSVIAASYAPGDISTIAGGTFTTRASVQIISTSIYSLALVSGGLGFHVGQVVPLVGGSQSTQAYITVTTIGGGGAITGFTVTNPGVFLQNATTLTGTSTFSLGYATFTPVYMPSQVGISNSGVYSVIPANPVAEFSTSGTGSGATYNLSYQQLPPISNGDWLYVTGVGGMTELNGRTFVVKNATGTTAELTDVYGANINSAGYGAYTAGGIATRVYTLSTPWGEEDLDWLKFEESADVMSICCVNQQTATEYQPQDLRRISNNNWNLTAVAPSPTIAAPAAPTAATSVAGSVGFSFRITAVSEDGTESIGSQIGSVLNAVNIYGTAGTITATWALVAGAKYYNVYMAEPNFNNVAVPAGSLFGFVGSSYASQFLNSNILPDFSQVPPQHLNPFARGQVLVPTILTPGVGMGAPIAIAITTSTGSGASLTPVVIGGALVAVLVDDPGANYLPTDTLTVTVGAGTAATLGMNVGPQNGTYPGVVSYFDQRRVYANSLNNPDTYWMSQPGAYLNFDKRIPTIDSDAITGTPWALQVNGIQFFVPMPGGLVVLTGLSAWQLNGGGASTPITPASQNAAQQAFNGCSATIPPIKIDFDIVYVQSKGSIYRDLAYNFFTNIYTGVDLTLNSSHLFTNFTIRQHAWSEEPNKLLWAVRDDGVLLSMTFLKQQEVLGWARHDTNGKFVSICSVTEPPVDAIYLAAQRTIGANTAYVIERMDNRNWPTVEQAWCVDCGAGLPQPAPDAILTASSAYGLGAISGITGLVGGQNYSPATTVSVIDDYEGPGTGAVLAPTIVNGVITAIGVSVAGSGYQHPRIVIVDPANTGTGASADAVLNNTMTFTASANVFVIGDVGKIIRMGGGKAIITAYTGPTQVTANMLSPIAAIQPNSGGLPMAAASGAWTMTTPVTTISGLHYLSGATVTGLYDGQVLPPTVVSASGTIDLPSAASAVTIGLGFQCQLQSLYFDAGEPTQQGRRKKIAAATIRIESSRGIKVGSNQVDGSTLSPPQLAPIWRDLDILPDKAIPAYNDPTTLPLYTGDARVPVQGGFQTPGQVCVQQDNPLPMNILAFVNEALDGDRPEQAAAPREKGRK